MGFRSEEQEDSAYGKVVVWELMSFINTFSQRGLLDPIKLAYDLRCRKAGS